MLLPYGLDAELARNELAEAGLDPELCRDIEDLVCKLDEGAGVAVIGEEVLAGRAAEQLFRVFDAQQTWSDLPVIVLIRDDGPLPESLAPLRAFERHAKIKTTFLQRPVPSLSLVSSIRAGLKSRLRQYQVRDLLAELNDDVRQRDDFLAMLGHELRNPVSSIGYVAELFEMAGLELRPERAAWGARVISRQVRHLSRLLDQLLDVARVQSGKIELEKEPVDLCSVVEQCVESGDASGGCRQLTVKLSACSVTVLGDRVRLCQVVNNLLENAVKYTADGGRVEIEVARDGSDAILAVSDNGRGMSAATLSQVFKPFYQEARTRTGRSAGLGLGLAMVENLVRLHGGTIAAASPGEGLGSRFEMRLPRLHGEAAGEPEAKVERSASGGSLRLLIVEDNVEVAKLFAMLLKTLGHQSHVVHNGLEGVEAATASPPDLAFVDIGLPDIDGAEVARRIRAKFPDGGPRLVALTGFPERPEDGGVFDDYLLKPVSRQRVEELLRTI
ncbi:MAG TPA: hybrid sensor histidine kinase/response regulator [Gammaproteobacteria bacterium]|nr:hybrid sensor histidine kinase/response regulator [Gammaproteobacteria bacterium]